MFPDLNPIKNRWSILARHVYENIEKFDDGNMLKKGIQVYSRMLGADREGYAVKSDFVNEITDKIWKMYLIFF